MQTDPPDDPKDENLTHTETGADSQEAGVSESPQAETATATEASTPPAAYSHLKSYCDQHQLKCVIEPSPFDAVSIEFKNGRTTRTVYVSSEEGAEALTKYQLQNITFLSDYSAVCSYEGRWIEAAVRAHGPSPRQFAVRRSIFGVSAARSDQPAEIEVSNADGLRLCLTEKPGILFWLDYVAPIYLKVEGIGITEHDKAVNLLEDLSNALFMHIDFKFDSPLTLLRDRARRISKATGALDEDNQLTYPRFSYEKSPSALYWYARSAVAMPLLQFLAFYQCIEFFFPQYSRQETITKIKNVLKDPSFDGTKDSDINGILNATLEGRRGSLLDERKQLAATLKQCVDRTALRDFLNETENRKRYYGTDYKKISDKKLALSDDLAIVDQTAERIYDIRCKVVHTKNLEGTEREEMILPFSKEADLMTDDVELIKFLARKVLIASSVPFKA